MCPVYCVSVVFVLVYCVPRLHAARRGAGECGCGGQQRGQWTFASEARQHKYNQNALNCSYINVPCSTCRPAPPLAVRTRGRRRIRPCHANDRRHARETCAGSSTAGITTWTTDTVPAAIGLAASPPRIGCWSSTRHVGHDPDRRRRRRGAGSWQHASQSAHAAGNQRGPRTRRAHPLFFGVLDALARAALDAAAPRPARRVRRSAGDGWTGGCAQHYHTDRSAVAGRMDLSCRWWIGCPVCAHRSLHHARTFSSRSSIAHITHASMGLRHC